MFGTTAQPQSTGIFGGAQSKPAFGGQPTQSQGLFGPSQPASNPQGQTGIFGGAAPQSTGAFGAASTNQQAFLGTQGQGQPTSPFGAAQSSFGTGGQTTQGGIFGQQQPASGGGGIFGGGQQQQAQTQQGGIFGQQQPQQQQQQQGGIFGTTNPPQNTQGQGIFGQGQPQQQQGQTQGGIFGQPAQPQQGQTGGGLFGTSTSSAFQPTQQAGSTGIFGQANPQQQQQQQQQQGGMFGQPQQPAQSTGIFGGGQQQQTQQPPSQGGLFGTFAAPSQPAQGQTGVFGAASSNPTSTFGQTSINMTSATQGNNKLGGTAWGVPTNQPNSNQNMQPVRSKNPKLDAKHLVKCIAALEQFHGNCKEELRISYVQSGGQQPALNQPAAPGSAGMAKPQQPHNPLSSIPSFGGSTNLGAGQPQAQGGSTLFGGQQQTQQQGGSTLFGGAKSAQPAGGSTLFGAQQPQQQQQQGGSTLFGQQPAQTTMFGTAQPQQQQQQQPGATGSLFGATPPAQNYGQPQQQSTLFGAQSTQPTAGAMNPPGSLFGANPAQPQSQQAGTSLFGATNPLQPPPMLAPTPGAAQNPSPMAPQYGQPTAQPGGLAASPIFSQLAAPLYQQMQQTPPMDPSLQLVLPQLLLNSLGQPQPQGQNAAVGNPAEYLENMINNLSAYKQKIQQKSETSERSGARTNPFDDFIKSDKNGPELPANFYETSTLFSRAEVQQFQNFDTRSYLDRVHHHEQLRQEQFRLRNSYKPAPKKLDPLTESNYKVISRRYKNTQDQARKKATLNEQDLPNYANFTVQPSMEKLRNMSEGQLEKVENVTISNSFGSIQFLEPISLKKRNLGEILKIAQDVIEIDDIELEERKLRMTFKNFGRYTSLSPEQRSTLHKKKRTWINNNGMVEINHNKETGDLIVETVD